MEASTEMAPEVIGLENELEDLIGPIRHKLEQGTAHAEALDEAARAQRKENAKMKKALQLIDPTFDPPPTPKKKGQQHVGVKRSNGTATGFGISLEGCRPFVDEIRAQSKDQKFVTQKAIYQAIGSDQTKASAAFRCLRSIGFLAKAGRAPDSRRERWRIDKSAAYEAALKDASARTEEDDG